MLEAEIPLHPVSKRKMFLPGNTFPDIYWITGGSCGGKTVCSNNISKKLGVRVYSADEKRQLHYEKAIPDLYPTLSRKIDWPSFFNSDIQELSFFWESLCFERMEMIFQDLSELNISEKVIVEGVYASPEIIRAVTPNAPVVFLFADRGFLKSCYYGRESTLWMEGPFSACEDPEKMKQQWISKWIYIDDDRRQRAVSYGMPCLEANESTDWLMYEAEIERLLLL